ncbi:hypothetical protein HDU76_011253, partial [Blyttiomyces sp. JEL0837]
MSTSEYLQIFQPSNVRVSIREWASRRRVLMLLLDRANTLLQRYGDVLSNQNLVDAWNDNQRWWRDEFAAEKETIQQWKDNPNLPGSFYELGCEIYSLRDEIEKTKVDLEHWHDIHCGKSSQACYYSYDLSVQYFENRVSDLTGRLERLQTEAADRFLNEIEDISDMTEEHNV